MNLFFTSMRRVFVCFFEEIEDSKKAYRNYLTFNGQKIIYLTEARTDLDPRLIDLQHPSTNHIEFEIGAKNLQKKHKKKKLRPSPISKTS